MPSTACLSVSEIRNAVVSANVNAGNLQSVIDGRAGRRETRCNGFLAWSVQCIDDAQEQDRVRRTDSSQGSCVLNDQLMYSYVHLFADLNRTPRSHTQMLTRSLCVLAVVLALATQPVMSFMPRAAGCARLAAARAAFVGTAARASVRLHAVGWLALFLNGLTTINKSRRVVQTRPFCRLH